MKGPILAVFIAVMGMVCLVASGCSKEDEITAISVTARLDRQLDADCILSAVRSTQGVRHADMIRLTVAPSYPRFHFMSIEIIGGLPLTGGIIHTRVLPDRQDSLRFDVMYQGDKMSPERTDKTHALLARVAKRVTEDCGAKFTDGQGLRCKPEAPSCTQVLAQDAAKP